MTHDFNSTSGGAEASLSPEARARKRDLLPVLQRQLSRRRARRQAAAGGAIATAAAIIVGAGAMLSLHTRPQPAEPAGLPQVARAGDAPEHAAPPERSTSPRAARPVSFTLVRNDPSLIERHRIDDTRLVQELRSAGYEAGLVRTPDRVFIMPNER